MTLTDNYVKGFTKKMYRFINEGHVVKLEKMKGCAGHITWPDNPNYVVEVKLDYRDDILATFIHEFIHYLYPDMLEDDVAMLESKIMNKLTKRQAKNILKRLVEVL